jgi:uncharacterized membrane protein
MDQASISRFAPRRRTLAGLFAPLALVAGGALNAAGQAGTTAASGTAGGTADALGTAVPSFGASRYSVINLDPEGGAFPLLNQKGQAAFGSFVFGTQGFFDGDRIYPLGSLGGGYTLARGLNNNGVVVGESQDDSPEFGAFYAFRWTVGGGMRAIPGSLGGIAYGVNDRNQVVGQVPVEGVTARAVRWDPNGRIVNLGPLPLSLSEAYAINRNALAGGFADVPGGAIHATVWDPAGRQTDLGTLGGGRAFTLFANERNEVAGYSDNAANDREEGFFWSPRAGLVATGAVGPSRLVAGFNDRGEVVGDTSLADGTWPYLWSSARGLTLLPRGGAVGAGVAGVNNHTVMVGFVERKPGDSRAVRWNGLANPVDLNTLLYRPPAGLVVQGGAAINDAGVILAYSNAGLLMLRPGTRGTDAPVLGPVIGLPDTVTVGQDVRLILNFVDNAPSQTHRASVKWEDNCTSPHPLVRESGGVGEVSFQHRFCAPGYYVLTVQVRDSGGRTTETRRAVVVNDPATPAVSGQGSLARAPAQARTGGQPLRFALWAPLGNAAAAKTGAAAAGSPVVGLYGPFQFRSEQVGTQAIGGQQVRLEGSGRYNGRPGYRFLIDATDGDREQAGSGDRMRVRITHADAGGKEVVDYDNGAPGGNGSGTAAKAAAPSAADAPDRTVVADGGISVGT